MGRDAALERQLQPRAEWLTQPWGKFCEPVGATPPETGYQGCPIASRDHLPQSAIDCLRVSGAAVRILGILRDSPLAPQTSSKFTSLATAWCRIGTTDAVEFFRLAPLTSPLSFAA